MLGYYDVRPSIDMGLYVSLSVNTYTLFHDVVLQTAIVSEYGVLLSAHNGSFSRLLTPPDTVSCLYGFVKKGRHGDDTKLLLVKLPHIQD